MQKNSNSLLLGLLTNLFILLAIAKMVSLSIWWFLPNDGVELQERENYKAAYQRVDFKNMLISPSIAKAKEANKKAVSSSGVSITNMILKGLYGKGSNGMAIVALKSSANKTTVVSVGEVFSGYTLKTILHNSVIFTKNTKEYTLSMGKSKALPESAVSVVPLKQTKTQVDRKDINDYISSRKDIWKDISINALKNGDKIEGFKVSRINKNSPLAILGLERGDVIVAANNVELTSYKDVLNIYKNIKKLNTIQLVVRRNNQEQELVFDIE